MDDIKAIEINEVNGINEQDYEDYNDKNAYWKYDIESDIRNFYDENELMVEELKKQIYKISKEVFNKCFEKYNFDENYIMLEVAKALQQRAHEDKNYKDFKKWYKCISYLKIIVTRKEIDFNDIILKQYASLFEKIYLLGYFHGSKEALEIDSLFYEDIYKDYYHKKKSTDFIRKRHAKDNMLYAEAIAYAKTLWDSGSELMHHEMARQLRKKGLFSGLSLVSLREKLKPVAKTYGKLYNPNEKSKKR